MENNNENLNNNEQAFEVVDFPVEAAGESAMEVDRTEESEVVVDRGLVESPVEGTSGHTQEIPSVGQVGLSDTQSATSTVVTKEQTSGKRRLSIVEEAFTLYLERRLQEVHEEDGYWLPIRETNQNRTKLRLDELNFSQLNFVQRLLDQRRVRLDKELEKDSNNPRLSYLSGFQKSRDQDGDERREREQRESNRPISKPALDVSKWLTKPQSFDGTNKRQAKEFIQKTEDYMEMARVTDDRDRIRLFYTLVTGAAWDLVDQVMTQHRKDKDRYATWVEVKTEFLKKMGTPKEDRLQAAERELASDQENCSLEKYYVDFDTALIEYNLASEIPLTARESAQRFIGGLNRDTKDDLIHSSFTTDNLSHLSVYEHLKKIIDMRRLLYPDSERRAKLLNLPDNPPKRFDSSVLTRAFPHHFKNYEGEQRRDRYRSDPRGRPFDGQCHTCGTPGHRAADCPRKAKPIEGNKRVVCPYCTKR